MDEMAKVETKKISDLLPDPNNVNRHTQKGHGLVENSIRRRGVGRGILAAGKNTEKPVIMAGNLTHEKARDAGIDEVVFVHTTGNQLVVTVRDDLDPTSPEAIALGIEDNEAGKLSYNPDIDLLAAMSAGDNGVLSKLKEDDKIFGDMLAGMGVKNAEPVDAEPQIDRAAELQEKWKTATGQLWQLGEHRLLIGDCTVRENVERLMGGERADMVFTDPPFGNNKGYGRGQLGVRYIEGDQNTDILFKLPEIIESILDGCFFVVWVQWYTYADLLSAFSGKEIDTVIIWDKKSPGLSGGGGYGEQYEMAVVFVNGKPKHSFFRGNVFTESRHVEGGERNPHPTMKSVKVCQDIIIDLSSERKIVVDFFVGSGTTIIAAHNLNRRCYAMEISEKYSAVILQRFEDATGITPIML